MAVNRLSLKLQGSAASGVPTAPAKCHEAIEISLCDRGMCFTSATKHEIGTMLCVDYESLPDFGDLSLGSEAIVVDCSLSECGMCWKTTVLFTGS